MESEDDSFSVVFEDDDCGSRRMSDNLLPVLSVNDNSQSHDSKSNGLSWDKSNSRNSQNFAESFSFKVGECLFIDVLQIVIHNHICILLSSFLTKLYNEE